MDGNGNDVDWCDYVTVSKHIKNNFKGICLPHKPAKPDVEYSVTSATPCLPTCHCASYHVENGLNLGTISQHKINALFYRSCFGHGVS